MTPEKTFTRPELVVGAGDMEKLMVASRFGADAIYCGTNDFSLRARCRNFSPDDIAAAARLLHSRGQKIYITVNSIIHEDRLEALREYLRFLDSAGVDAVIFSDMAVLTTARELGIRPRLHLSTQASCANSTAMRFYRDAGVSRVNLARECSLDEIRRFAPVDGLSVEAFIHGAMCMSYSGRCLLSNFMAARGANDGACAQACRWKYHLVEEKRPGEYMPVVEEGGETYIFNSRDLMALDLLPELHAASVGAFKVEGRIKGPHYVGLVTLAYRMAFDDYARTAAEGRKFEPSAAIREMLGSVSNRGYITGFYLGPIKSGDHNYEDAKYIKTYRLVGMVGKPAGPEEYFVSARNNIFAGRTYEFVTPAGICEMQITAIRTPDGESVLKTTNQKEAVITVKGTMSGTLGEYDMIRERNSD